MAILSSSRDISLLSPAQIRAWLPEEVGMIQSGLFQYFMQTKLLAFTPLQVANFNSSAFNSITQSLPLSGGYGAGLSARQFGYLTPSQLQAMTPK
jgi:hypothetical protein